MSLSIGSLWASTAGQTDLVGRSLERLASGSRLNSSDDAAGLAIADGARLDTRISAQAIRNANDALSAARIADDALGRVGDLTGRMAELAAQAASGLLNDAQRGALEKEFGALHDEIDRTASTTTFNDTNLLTGGTTTVQVGSTGGPESQLPLTGVDASASSLGLAGASLATQDGARAAIDAVAGAADTVALARAALGAEESRVTATIATLRVRTEQQSAAAGQIEDADYAAESASELSQLIRGRLGVAVQAQANQRAGDVLALLSSRR